MLYVAIWYVSIRPVVMRVKPAWWKLILLPGCPSSSQIRKCVLLVNVSLVWFLNCQLQNNYFVPIEIMNTVYKMSILTHIWFLTPGKCVLMSFPLNSLSLSKLLSKKRS